MSDIDFASLSVKDTLDLAIAIEEDARERYLEFADQMEKHHTPEAALFFRKMADIEKGHAERLRGRRKAEVGDAEATVDPNLAMDVEAPDYDQARAFMTARRALEVAYESEVKAYRFYDGALTAASGEELRSLYEDLRQQESRHQEMIQEFMSRLPEEADVDPDDYVDESHEGY